MNVPHCSAEDAELRLLDHAVYLQRDGLTTVGGMDESGHMDAVGLGWVVMMPEGDRPLILQKAGGMQGIFDYLAFAPSRGVGAYVVINMFDFAAATTMTEFINELIEVLAPR
jgi:D-alanyl-D-alanine-carboxypeptidase/D-alanyl-D-alanine-endopeptidase